MIRDWARSLLACEALADTVSEPTEPATVRVYHKLRQRLCAPVGVDGFQALASRALALAKSESPRLSAVQVTADGRLNGFSEVESHTNADQDAEVGVILIAQLLWLFLTFLGEATTLRLIEDLRIQVEARTESGMTGSPAAASNSAGAFESLLRQVDRLKSVSERVEALAAELPGMEDGLVSVAGNLRNIAMVLDVFALIRSKSEELREDLAKQPLTSFVM
jgi:hypothetical protein